MSTPKMAVEGSLVPAEVPTHELKQTLRWWDGFAISLSIPAALFMVIVAPRSAKLVELRGASSVSR